MDKLVATLTPDGQVTIPEEVREALDLQPNDRIIFTVDNGTVTLTPEQPTLAWRAGAVKPPPGMSDDIAQVIKEANEEYFAEKYPEFRRQ